MVLASRTAIFVLHLAPQSTALTFFAALNALNRIVFIFMSSVPRKTGTLIVVLPTGCNVEVLCLPQLHQRRNDGRS